MSLNSYDMESIENEIITNLITDKLYRKCFREIYINSIFTQYEAHDMIVFLNFDIDKINIAKNMRNKNFNITSIKMYIQKHFFDNNYMTATISNK